MLRKSAGGTKKILKKDIKAHSVNPSKIFLSLANNNNSWDIRQFVECLKKRSKNVKKKSEKVRKSTDTSNPE